MEGKLIGSNNSMMEMRLMILRTISDVWKTPSLRGQIEEMSPSEIFDYFEKNYGYVAPFANFGLDFIHATAKYNYYGDNQWTKPTHEVITITLPRAESAENFDEAEKLFEYYSYFPTLLGPMTREAGGGDSGGGGSTTASPSGNFAPGLTLSAVAAGTDLHGNDEDLGVSQGSFLGFGATMLKVIAAAWENPALASKLDYNDWQEYFATEDEYYDEIKRMLDEYYHFDFPWAFNLKLVFASPDESFWEEKGGEWVWRQKGANGKALFRNTVTLEIPQEPEGMSGAATALALARYNMIGPAYPFTCS